MKKELVVIGDRVLIEPDEGQDRTETGLYLPQGIKEKEKVQSGRIVKTGPGYPIPDPQALEVEPWQAPQIEKRYFPLQAQEGDYCIFLRSAGIEIEFAGKKYVVVPHSAILVVLKENVDKGDV
ncbi:MAG: co-chaperone GroES family protein [Candidatus Omnitrophica bacterium]|nr:co-chaperone GroES family protein [Candidatus Omnitrophota bacterium]